LPFQSQESSLEKDLAEMNVLLLYPEFPSTFWSFKHALKFIRKKAAFPPLGLLTIAAMLPREWSLRLVDLNIGTLTASDLAWADWAFVSGMVVQKQSARDVIARCRREGLKIVAGGPLFTNEWEAFPEVDHFVLNEAELTLPPFLADLAAGDPERIYRSADFADIGTAPVPRWELVDFSRYASMSIQYSRGCPFQCEFCNVTVLFGHRHRTKSASQIIAELDELYAQGWRSGVFFVDDNFIGNKKHLKNELLPALIDWIQDKRGITFFTEVSINLADDEKLMALLAAAGFTTVFIGIETPDDLSLNECSKKQNRNRDLIGDIHRIQRAGLQVQGGFILGFDNDNPSIFQRQIDFIQNSGIVMAMVGMLQAPPGTKLYERLRLEGRLRGEISGDNVDGTTNIIPAMGLDTLREGYKTVLDYIYSPEKYYQRVKTFLNEYRPAAIAGQCDLQYKLAFFRSLYRLGIFGKERFHYWRLLLWTGLHHPRLFPLAVTLAIYGHHFRKVCELRIL
jgi:radical SAM superfamily enzyme YgiQ (UPF0313 family)